MRTIQTKIYQYDELSDSAKAKARQWYTSDWDCFHSDFVIEDAVEIAKLFGLTIGTRPVKTMGGNTTHEACIYWSGFSCQGDGACFEGTYRYKAGSVNAVKAYLNDPEVIRIATALQAAQRKHFYSLTASITHRDRYYHAYSMDIDVNDSRENSGGQQGEREAVVELLRDFANWIFRALESSYYDQTSDEAVAETIIANEYEFTETGERI